MSTHSHRDDHSAADDDGEHTLLESAVGGIALVGVLVIVLARCLLPHWLG